MGEREPQRFKFKDKPLICPICGHDHFWQGRATIEKGIVWPQQTITYTCEECRHIIWFED